MPSRTLPWRTPNFSISFTVDGCLSIRQTYLDRGFHFLSTCSSGEWDSSQTEWSCTQHYRLPCLFRFHKSMGQWLLGSMLFYFSGVMGYTGSASHYYIPIAMGIMGFAFYFFSWGMCLTRLVNLVTESFCGTLGWINSPMHTHVSSV